MVLKVFRARRTVTYEYQTEEEIDTSAFPECAGMDAAQRLRWCAEHPDRVWGGSFDEWLNGYEFSHSRDGDSTVFLFGGREDDNAFPHAFVNGVVLPTDDLGGDKYPRVPTDDEVREAQAATDAAYAAAVAAAAAAAPQPGTGKPWRRPRKGSAEASKVGGAHAALTAADMQRESHTVNGQTFELVHCPPGTFTMGSPEDEADREDNETQHEVTLTRVFALGVFPVTQALWEAVTGENPSEPQGGDDAPQRPVDTVSWFDSVRFCNALSAKLGLAAAYTVGEGEEPEVTCDVTASGFRLPTEAEWEYAARSGGDAFVYAGSDDIDEVGWDQDNSNQSSLPVGCKMATRWGLYDLTGNVLEWCWDRFGDYPSESSTDPVGAGEGLDRVYRGGCWCSTAGYARAARRDRDDPGYCYSYLGLRLSRTIT